MTRSRCPLRRGLRDAAGCIREDGQCAVICCRYSKEARRSAWLKLVGRKDSVDTVLRDGDEGLQSLGPLREHIASRASDNERIAKRSSETLRCPAGSRLTETKGLARTGNARRFQQDGEKPQRSKIKIIDMRWLHVEHLISVLFRMSRQG